MPESVPLQNLSMSRGMSSLAPLRSTANCTAVTDDRMQEMRVAGDAWYDINEKDVHWNTTDYLTVEKYYNNRTGTEESLEIGSTYQFRGRAAN